MMVFNYKNYFREEGLLGMRETLFRICTGKVNGFDLSSNKFHRSTPYQILFGEEEKLVRKNV